MKKAISIFLLLLANIALLVHSVVPHHHHYASSECFNSHFVACKSLCGHDHSHGHESNSDKHNGENCDGDCSIVDIFSRTDNNEKTTSHIGCDCGYTRDILQATIQIAEPDVTMIDGLPFRHKPFLITFNSEYYSRCTGLRAPPVC